MLAHWCLTLCADLSVSPPIHFSVGMVSGYISLEAWPLCYARHLCLFLCLWQLFRARPFISCMIVEMKSDFPAKGSRCFCSMASHHHAPHGPIISKHLILLWQEEFLGSHCQIMHMLPPQHSVDLGYCPSEDKSTWSAHNANLLLCATGMSLKNWPSYLS